MSERPLMAVRGTTGSDTTEKLRAVAEGLGLVLSPTVTNLIDALERISLAPDNPATVEALFIAVAQAEATCDSAMAVRIGELAHAVRTGYPSEALRSFEALFLLGELVRVLGPALDALGKQRFRNGTPSATTRAMHDS